MKDRKLLMIPGPIEFEPAVLSALGAPTTSHTAPDFIEAFGQALERMRQVFLSTDGQPFVLAGSGTLAMDTAGANLVEPGDRVLGREHRLFWRPFRYLARALWRTGDPGARPGRRASLAGGG